MKNNKSLGQHWLKNRQILDQIAAFAADPAERELYFEPDAETSAPEPPALCLEIGPGLGTLTSALLRRFPEVVAVEFDERLAKNLPNSFPGKNLKVIHQDFLTFDLASLARPYAVAANIPYYITSPIITRLLTPALPNFPKTQPSPTSLEPSKTRPATNSPATNSLASPEPPKTLPTSITLLIQKEVAARIAAAPGRHTVLSLWVQNRARVALGPVVPRAEFTPPPQVDSQILLLDPRPVPLIPEAVFALIKSGFAAPRKKLINNLPIPALPEILKSLNLDSSVRPADLSLENWHQLFQKLR